MTFTVTVHTKSGCPSCDAAKAWLEERSIPYATVIHDDDADRAALYDRLGLTGKARIVPQILFTEAGTTIRAGGFDALDRSGIADLCR